jgi:bifunctional non-homologous end joining protein LigD
MAAQDEGLVSIEVDGRRLALRRLDKVMYPATATTAAVTKAGVLDYARRVAPAWISHLEHRPVTRKRWPDGVTGQPFFEKNLPLGTPDWVPRVTLPVPGSSRDREVITYPYVQDLATLIWVMNLAALELHVPQYRADPDGTVADPDRLVIDLDPGPGTTLAEVSAVAVWVAERLLADGLTPFPVTSGSKGMQLYAAISGEQDGSVVSGYAKRLAEDLEREHRDLVVSRMAKDLRPGKVFVDCSQNNTAKTTVCPYSPRGRDQPTVAAPRRWDELGTGLRQLTMSEVADRFEADGDLLDGLGAAVGPRLPDG